MKPATRKGSQGLCLFFLLAILWGCAGFRVGQRSSRRPDLLPTRTVALFGAPSDDEETDIGGLKEQLKSQQQQIDSLIQVLQQQQPSPAPAPVAPAQVPYKAMLFIDGTWLYYSLHERAPHECPFIQKYGPGWQHRYDLNWTALPGIICDAVEDAEHYFNRKVEIVRASVYTSYKADTNKKSFRYQLFEDMRDANYDVNMMETVGKSEKCVDIQLAVDMLYYATDGGGAYDVAFLLTGDKDFMPAMIRTRQKGKLLGLISMVRGCNRALIETDSLKDFDVLWLEKYLDQFVVPKSNTVADEHKEVSTFTLNKVIYDFVRLSGFPYVNSRDLGRLLKTFSISGVTLLDIVKEYYGGLWNFLPSGGQFLLSRSRVRGDKSFTIALAPDAESKLMEEAKQSAFSPAEKLFFEKYDLRFLENKELAYPNTMLTLGLIDEVNTQLYDKRSGPSSNGIAQPVALPDHLSRDYSECTVAELKDICRENSLPVSGVKAALLDRVTSFMEEERQKFVQENRVMPANTGDPKIASHLVDLIKEYLHARGGKASSRDVGRYLAANQDSLSSKSALTQLKSEYGSLGSFLGQQAADVFYTDNAGVSEGFKIGIRQQEA